MQWSECCSSYWVKFVPVWEAACPSLSKLVCNDSKLKSDELFTPTVSAIDPFSEFTTNVF